MEQENKKSGVVALLVVIIAILAVLCVLFATGTISFNGGNSANNGGDNGQVIDDNDIDLYKLEAIYSTLGIDKNETQSLNHCLNYNLSSNDYLKNSKAIFSLYAMINDYTEYNEELRKIMTCDVVKSDNCSSPQPFLSAAAARIIPKEKANIIISKYNLQNTDFLMEIPHTANIKDDMYGYYTDYASGGVCNYIVKHNANIQEDEAQNVTVIDKQTVIKLEYDQEKFDYVYDNEVNQTVTYILKKADAGYSLDSVTVK